MTDKDKHISIQEMAEIHAPITKDDTFDKVRKQILKQTSFESGANTVLVEIEKAMNLGEPPYLISVEQAYSIVKNRIKELKGE